MMVVAGIDGGRRVGVATASSNVSEGCESAFVSASEPGMAFGWGVSGKRRPARVVRHTPLGETDSNVTMAPFGRHSHHAARQVAGEGLVELYMCGMHTSTRPARDGPDVDRTDPSPEATATRR